MTDEMQSEIAALLAEAEAKAAELKDDTPADEARRIEREHAAIIEKIEAAKRARDAGDGAKQTRQIRLSPKDVRNFQKIADQAGIRAQVDALIDAGLTREQIGPRVVDLLANCDANRAGAGGTTQVEINLHDSPRARMNTNTLDNPAFVRSTIEDALYSRMSGKAPEGAAREFVGRRLSELDDALAESRGERRSWLGQRAGGMHTTSDFPELLTSAGNRVLQDTYQAASSPLLRLARVRNSSDFRPINVLRLSEAPALEKVNEAGEITHGSRGEEREAFRLETFGRIFSLSRQAYVNDDLGAFADFNSAFGRAAAQTVAAQLVTLFTANSGDGASLDDGSPLFSTTRGNKAATGTAITVATVGAARQALRETKGLDGVTPLALSLKYLVVGSAKETEAEQLLTSITSAQTSNANPFSGRLELLVEPRFTGNAWRLFADTAQAPIVSIAYLDGRAGPILEQREGWTTLGVEFRAVLDFGAGITDWRGAYLNPGA